MPLTRFVKSCVASMDDDVELSILFLFDIRRFDFERRSDDGKLYKNVPIYSNKEENWKKEDYEYKPWSS